MELLVAIALLSLIVLFLSSIDLFSHHNVISSDRRVKVQNEVSYVLERMNKEIVRAIGNERVNGPNTVVNTGNIAGDAAIRVYIDANGNGARDTAAGTDCWIAYRLRPATALPVADRYQIRYCPRCTAATCVTCAAPNAWGTADNILSRQITTPFIPTKPGGATLSDNFVTIEITACWDPDGVPEACGTSTNPSVTMRTRIKMPSVSTN